MRHVLPLVALLCACPPSGPAPQPTIVELAANPPALAVGSSVTLSWTVSDAQALRISGVGAVSGSSLSVFVSQTTTFTLTATNATGQAQATTIVTVGDVTPGVDPDDIWTWHDIAGAKCADGSPTGFAVNPHRNGSGKVLVFLEGGGLCVDQSTCTGAFKTAVHFSYTASDFATEMTDEASAQEGVNETPGATFTWPRIAGQRGIWDRTTMVGGALANPFADYNFVFVPYCTADLHSGARQDTASTFRTPSQMWHVGYPNFALYAARMRAMFPNPPAVVLSGGSAGGFGTIYNYSQLKALYPSTPMTVITDAGVPFYTGDEGFSPRQGFFLLNFVGPGTPSFEEDWFADAWGLDATHPAGLQAIERTGAQRSIYSFQQAFIANVTAHPSDTFAIVSATNDWLVPWYLHLNVLGSASPSVADGLADVSEQVSFANVRTLFVSATAAPDPSLRPWWEHHGFIVDDVSVWSETGLLAWLQALAP